MPDQDKTDTKTVPSELKVDYQQIGAMLTQLAIDINKSKSPPDAEDDPVGLQADYQSTLELVKLFSDIRFRCLVFVTAVIAVANALLPGTGNPGIRIALGFVGFFTTLGIAVYELRNSQLYEAAINRAKVLETRLHRIKTSYKAEHGGLFNERPLYVDKAYAKTLSKEEWKSPQEYKVKFMPFLLVKVKHDRGLALIYGVVLGGWIYLIAHGVLSIPPPTDYWPPAPEGLIGIIAGVLGFLAFVLSTRIFIHHDENRFRPSEFEPPAEEPELKSPRDA